MDQPEAPEPVLLIIADISGYTRYMTANAKTLAHSQVIITELVKAIVRAVELPVEVAKLEGDAVFLYCRKKNCPWEETGQVIGARLLAFFRIFSGRLNELSASTTCSCQACAQIERLRLKIAVHSGEALFHRVFNFTELAGVDVIVVHRLLKNSIEAGQYLLLTDAAHRDVKFAGEIQWRRGTETYDDLGRIETFVHLPDSARPSRRRAGFAQRFAQSWKLFCKFWAASLIPKPCAHGHFHHLTCSAGTGRRAGFALLMVLLTPLLLPVGAIFALVHALKSSPRE